MTGLNRFLVMTLIPVILACTSVFSDISTISNDFIKIIVNDGPSDLGRFSIETSGGDLQRSSDDFQPLIYGRPIPWTSYTTILIDDQPYIFGGESPKHQKRVPTPLEFGKIVSHNVYSDKIETVCRFSPGVLVKQTVQFARNISTRVQDTALISYTVKNEDTTPHSVGLRILLDTKLGSNDGAPFRIGSDAVDSEISYSKSKLFDYWQTFDSLTSPNVIAQGTLTDHRYGVTPPDRISLVNWGTLFSSPWSFNYQQGRSFIREGEVENDTSLALYFNPTIIAPNDVKTVQTLYGLGGVQLAGGELALGVSGPSELFSTSKTPFLMMVYLRNSSQFISKDTKITIKLPSGFTTESGKTEFVLGDVDSMQTRQLPIRITPSSPTVGRNRISVEVTSSTLESNRIQHNIDVEGPARLKSKLQVPAQWKSDSSPYVKATLLVSNPTGHKISDVSLKLIPGPGVSVADFDIDKKELAVLPPKKAQSVNWMVKLDPKYSKFPLSVSLDSPDISKDTISAQIIATSSLEDSLKVSSKKEGSFLSVDIVALPELFKNESSAIVTTFADDELKFLRVRPTGGYNWTSEAQVKTVPGAVHFSPDIAKINRPVHIAMYFKLTSENVTVPIVVRAGNVIKEISP